MKCSLAPAKLKFLGLISLIFAINFSCNKDSHPLEDTVLKPTATSVDQQNLGINSRLEETYLSVDNLPVMGFETRTAVFHPLNKVDSKSTYGDKQNIDYLEKDSGYEILKYDLSPIDSIGGTFDSAKLELIASADGIDTVSVFKSTSIDWSEKSIPLDNALAQVALLGELNGEFSFGQKQEIALEKTKIVSDALTLVIPHNESRILDFALGEDANLSNPSVVVTYFVPRGAKALDMDKKTSQNLDDVAAASNEKSHQAVNAKASIANSPPDSRPSASTVSGSAPLKVQFGKGKSSDDKGIVSYKWYFMDGTTATGPNPAHTFTKPGIYKVILSIKDQEGLENGRIIIINVSSANTSNKPPDSRPSASTVSGNAPLKVQFGSSKSSDDKGIASYKWYFMDGTTATGPNPAHTFTKPGIYKVILSIRDQEGLENGRIIIVTVTGGANQPPDARPSASTASGDAPLKVQFGSSRSSDDTGIVAYKWNFRDGATATGPSPSHTFNNPGTHKVILTVTDQEGLTNSRYFIVTVTGTGSGSGSSGSSTGSGSSTEGSGGTSGGSGNGTSGGSNSNPSNGIKASTFGYNSSDATKALKAAINSSHSTIIVDKQSSDWVVGPIYLNGIRNKKIIFEQGVVLRAKRGAYRSVDRLFQFVNSDDIEIEGYGATFAMNKSEYSGQQNHALSLIACTNVTVKGLTLRDSGGDGIYIARYNESDYCRNIRIEDVLSTNNKRQGMTVLSVDGLVVKNSTFSGTSGVLPGAGVDFEPESTRDRLDNIVFENTTFKDNYGPGIMFALSKVNSSTTPLDVTFRNTKVSNNYSTSNPRPYRTEIQLGMSTNYRSNPIKGSITFDGLTVENSRWSAFYTKKTLEAYHVNVKNAILRNVSRGSNLPVIDIGVLSYANSSNANMGGFTFENVLIDYDGVDPSLQLHGPSHNNWNLRNMRGEIRVKSSRGIRLNDTRNKLENTNSSTVNLRVVKN